jgi:phosphomethylpyrimidine synthase
MERLNDVKLNDLRFEYLHKPMRAKKELMSQLYYAKQGLITRKWNILPFENQRIGLQEQTKAMQCQHPGNSFVLIP